MKDLFEERYRATPAALDRESIIEHLLTVAEDNNMHDCVFNKCEAMIKQYKISANPDWDLSDILDTFTTKQLQELLQYVMDNYKNESLNEDVENIEIPAPYNQYYEFSPNEVNFDELPDAFDHYKDLKVVAELYAKEEYEDALANNCLDFCWLVEDEIGKLLLVTTAGLRVYPITLEEIQDCVGDGSSDNYFDFDEEYTGEPSSTEYGDAMSRYFREMTDAIEKYNIRKIGRKRSIEYDGVVNGHKFFFVEGNTGTGHYAKELYIDGKEVNLYQSKESARSFAYLNEMNQFGILSLVKMLETDNFSGIVYRDVDTLDDYEESLVEDTEMSDAQRLALQELDSCLECGELNAEQHALAYQIQWDINFEDVLLFINGIDADLKDIKHVEYGDCDETKFDGCYSVTFHNGDVKKYGWHDFDMTGSLTCIDCNEGLLGNLVAPVINPMKLLASYDGNDGWDKPFDWTERYVKDGFVIFNNYQGAWHLEQTRPKTKHIGNYKSLEAAKAAGDAEINKRNAKNKDKPVQFGVHSFTSDSIVFRGTEDECAEYINKSGLENDAEIYMIRPDDRHYREVSENLAEDYPRGDAENFIQHPMNYNVTGELDFAVADDVKVYLHRGPGKQREFYIVIGDQYVQHSFNKLETVKKYLEKQKLLKESVAKRFNNGDRVYVTVNNRQGNVTKMVSNDVVEVEFEANGTYPARIDRYYVDEVELIDMTPDLEERLQDNTSAFDYIKSKYNATTRFGTTVIAGDRLDEIDKDLVSRGYCRGKRVTYSTGYAIDYVSSEGDGISVGVNNVPQYDRFGAVVDHNTETVIARNKLDLDDEF